MTSGNQQQIEAAAAMLRNQRAARPRVGIVAGTGLAEVTRAIDANVRLTFDSIPYFCRPTAPGHCGAWIAGELAGTEVVAMEGRLHGYEGYSAGEVAFGVRVMAALGVELLIVTSAAGGLNRYFRVGDLMVIEDHVNLCWRNPLVGPHDENSGLGYPDMSQPYDRPLIQRALAIGRAHGIPMQLGTYVGVLGPNYETRAEYRFFRRLGDAIGMSVVAEVIAAAQCGMRVLGLSVVTNVCMPDCLQATSAGEVITVARDAATEVRLIVTRIVEQFAAARDTAAAPA